MRQRHPALETAVFAAALLLTAFIGRELWRRHRASQPRAPIESAQSPVEARPMYSGGGRTEIGVTSVAPIKLTRVQRRKAAAAAVPSPQ